MGYVLHLPVYSTEDLPSFRASIKDGYAFKYVNSDCYWCNVFKVVQVSVAGTNVSIYLICLKIHIVYYGL